MSFVGRLIFSCLTNELQALFDIYRPFIEPFIKAISQTLLQPLALLQASTALYAYGLDTTSWLSDSSSRPLTGYLTSIPISFPLIGLIQLVQYLVACNVVGMTPGEYLKHISGVTGHSQGIVSGAIVAASTTRGHQAFPVVSVEPRIVNDSIEGGEGTPSPMLSVTGLALKDLTPHIKKTNSHLADNSKLFVTLHNRPRAFVVTGSARSLYGLVTNLRKIRVSSGADQSKVPFSKRKPAFNIRFLVVGVPYHSDYLKGATEKVLVEDLAGEVLWTVEDLKVPVYNTEDGSDLPNLKTSLTCSFCDQIFTTPINWTKAVDFPVTATHAIDFGPGGISGIGPLAARDLDGRGVHVVVIGDHAKGDAELYSSVEVKYEDWWAKNWAALVKSSDGVVHLDMPFSRLLSKPPIMVAGMTPTTVKAGFVSAVLDAGYHIELAGGAHYNAAALHAKVAEIQTEIPDGVSLTLNALYINPAQFTFQLPLWQEMRKEGLPIEGFCVAAGIPTTEKAVEIINGLRNAGIKHVSSGHQIFSCARQFKEERGTA
ncbi:hypothetical protein EDD85DRAFT_975426 [Armillaria nabsnona]|nr:hypothetical protein EDD85DRAFT_975426 [Armillaria nabsnona]